ncbi:hypothetical protein CDEST_10251 [Colletotrichum destructivum]|uniref:Uncharacterized protein n=1 Tax=Colletotrichum destructivum TaxID=34406 RepID=A0AAX4IQ46_9PEZI|nr:hypothetical protein CDEST_10251 [Colletotrichum destructivum]
MYIAPFLALLVAGAALAAAEGCHGDNLLRAMERHNGTAYCSSLLRPSGSDTLLSPRLPSDVPLTYAPTLVSSACSCLLGLKSTLKSPCPSVSATATATSTSTICSSRGGGGGVTGTTSSSTAAVSDTLTLSTTSLTDFGGGYTYSFPGTGLSASTGPTCGRDWATTMVQVTETMVSTVYVYSSGASSSSDSSSTGASTSIFSFPSDGDSGGRPAPPTWSAGSASAWVSTFAVGDSTFVSTVSGVPSDSLVVRPPGPTIWTLNGTTTTVPGAPILTASGKASSLTNTQADGASSWTLSWISTVPANESTATTSPLASSAALPDPPVVSTVTSDVGGVGSTWIVTVGVTSGPVPFPNTTSTLRSSEGASAAISVVTSIVSGVAVTWTAIEGSTVAGPVDSVTPTSAEAAPSRPVSGGFTVITSIVGGAESTWTLIDGSAISPSSSGTMSAPVSPTASSLKTASGTFSVITSVFGGVGSTWTVIGGSTFTGSSSTPTTAPPPTASVPVSASLVTSIVDGAASTWTVIGGSTVSGVLSETPTSTQSMAVSVITSVFGGVGSTWTLIGGSTDTGSSSTSDTVTPTLPPGASIVTSIIGGVVSSWTVIGGSTVFTSTSSALGTLSTTPTLPPGASVVTSIVGGIASSWTVIGGSTLFEPTSSSQSTPTLPPGASIVTSIVDGMVSSWTVIGGSTIFESASSALATPTLPPGATVITSVIEGVASSWTVIGGSTIFGSVSPTDAAGATVMTSVVGSVASSWTVIGGSTIFESSNSTAGVSPVSSPTPTVFTSLVNGVASTWTVIGGSTIFGSLTQSSTSTGNTSITASSLSSPSSFSPSSATTSSSATPTSGYDSAFTGISVIVARNGSTCYALPTPTASLHESLLNVTDREPPSIDAFYLDPATNSVKYLRLRDGNANPVLIDVSDPSRLAIVDGAGNVLSIDREGLHFTSANCSPKIDVFISGFFEQMAVLSGQSCRDTDEVPVNGTGRLSSSIPVSRREVLLDARQERSFDVVLHLRDQCGDLVRPDLPVFVSLGDTECVVLPDAAGDFIASCAFPGGESDSMECETSVQQTLDHLTQGSLAGTCPSFASVWSLLSRELDRIVNFDNLLRPFIDAGLDLGSDAGRGLRSVIDSFMRLYDFSTSTFQNSTSDASAGAGASSRLEDVIEEYGVAAIRTDVCRSLVSSETLALTFTAGVSTAPVFLVNISAVPSPRPEYERTVTDPTALACCPNASRCVVRDGQEFYPPEASIPGSDCLCGTTLEGRGVGFRTGRCVGYNQCNATSPCAGGAVCLVGSCCGFNVCVNGTECSAPAVGRRWVSLFGSETSGGMF